MIFGLVLRPRSGATLLTGERHVFDGLLARASGGFLFATPPFDTLSVLKTKLAQQPVILAA